MVLIGRIYDETPPGALRVLVDRLWPRGVRKEGAPWDVWLKEAAPSRDLRNWYHANPEEQGEFRRRYLEELKGPAGRAALAELRRRGAERPIALLTATRDLTHCQVPVLREVLEREPAD